MAGRTVGTTGITSTAALEPSIRWEQHAARDFRARSMMRTANFRPADAVAGLSLAGLLLPEAVAYSGLANLPPQAGVIGMFAGLLCYALIGRSRQAIVTATSSSAAVMAAATAA